MIALSLRGGSLRGKTNPSTFKLALSTWVESLTTSGFYQGDPSPAVPNVWSFRWYETHLISDAEYENEFKKHHGIYMFLRDEGTSRPYEPIYIGAAGVERHSLSTQQMSVRLYQRYIPRNHDLWYKPPKQLQIVERYGKEIRRNGSAWQTHRRQLESLGVTKVRLDNAECFSRLTDEGPYLTFHPLPIEQGEDLEDHKLRIGRAESALIRAAKDLGFELCNKEK